MTASFDLNFLPLARVHGQETHSFPGLIALAPPRRAARGREDETLFIYLTLSGNVSANEYAQWTARLGQRFYRTAGALTSALRAAVDDLNRILLERNLAAAGKSRPIVGRLIMGVLRERQLILALVGPTHAFHLGLEEMRHVYDSQTAGRGLGLSQNAPLSFTRLDLQAGDLLVLCAVQPAGWEVLLQSEDCRTSPAVLRRKLLSFSNDDFNAVLVQVQSGQGRIHLLRPGQEAAAPAVSRVPASSSGMPAPVKTVEPLPAAVPSEADTPSANLRKEPSVLPASSVPSSANPSITPAPMPSPVRRPPASAGGLFARPRVEGEFPEIVRRPGPRARAVYRSAARAVSGGRRLSERLKAAVHNFLPRLLPAPEGQETSLPSSFLIFAAIAVPVVVVTLAAIIYFRYGTLVQYQENMQLAVMALQAGDRSGDPTEARRQWETALYYVEQAERSRQTSDSAMLRQQAQTRLDALDGVVRLDFREALPVPLDKSVRVTRMAATTTDLYLLDATRGSVIRAFLTGGGYEIDPDFQCKGGTYNGYTVGALIDIVALPKINAYHASVLAIDAGGTLLYCAPENPPHALPLAAPELGWRTVTAFTLDVDNRYLYVLDAPAGAVWIYGGKSLEFSSLPTMFFGEQVPQNMAQATDLAVNGDDLYLLFQDGHVTACTLSRLDVQPTRCRDSITMIDNRLQRKSGPTLADATFTAMTFAAPPDPSLYFLEPTMQAVYRFSPRAEGLFLQGQFRAEARFAREEFTDSASALAFSPERRLFLCVGNQVYYAADMP